MRRITAGLTAALLLLAVAAPALATQPPDHKVLVCHRTLSDVNPWVVVWVDVETWDDDQNGHNRPHNKARDGEPPNNDLAPYSGPIDEKGRPLDKHPALVGESCGFEPG